MIELRLIQQALALAQWRNFARAAESVHITQPSLSRNIAELERRLGVRLFERDKDGVRATPFGEVLIAKGGALLAGATDLEREIRRLAGVEQGMLSVAVGPYPAEISVGAAIVRLQRKEPRLRIAVATADPEETVAAVQAGQFDLGVVNLRAADVASGVSLEPLPPHPVRLACRPDHPLCGRADLTLEVVLQYPLVGPPFAGDAAAAAASGHPAAGDFDPITGYFRPAIQVNSLMLARRIALDSDALWPAPLGLLAADIRAHLLVALPFSAAPMSTTYGFMSLDARPKTAAMVAFMTAVREIENEVAESEARWMRRTRKNDANGSA